MARPNRLTNLWNKVYVVFCLLQSLGSSTSCCRICLQQPSSATVFYPVFCVTGSHPTSIPFENPDSVSSLPAVSDLHWNFLKIQQETTKTLSLSKLRMEKQANKRRLTYSSSDLEWAVECLVFTVSCCREKPGGETVKMSK